MTSTNHKHEAEKAEYCRDTSEAMPDECRAALLPCPFCGGKAILRHLQVKIMPPKFAYRAACGSSNEACPVVTHTSDFATAQLAIAAWNTRAQAALSHRPPVSLERCAIALAKRHAKGAEGTEAGYKQWLDSMGAIYRAEAQAVLTEAIRQGARFEMRGEG